MTPILLDTCAVLWLANGDHMAEDALDALRRAPAVLVSPASAWEIGQLVARRRLALAMEAGVWWETLLSCGVRQAEMGPSILLASSGLQGGGIRDPIDRILVATARIHGLRIMTRDRPILNHAAAGHVQAIAC